VEKQNSEQRNFRVFGPDETLLNGLEDLFEETKRQRDAAIVPNDEFLAPNGGRDRDPESPRRFYCRGSERVHGTPGLFMNGVRYDGEWDKESLRDRLTRSA
jgi:hypothetical protein